MLTHQLPAARSLQNEVHPKEWEARVQLAACYRVFAFLGWTEMIYNHITLRLPQEVCGSEKQFLINPFGLHYSEVTASNLVKIDLKGKALGVPVYQLLGGQSRDYVECYSTGFPAKGTPTEVARACVEAGFRSYRISTDGRGPVSDRFENVNRTYEHCKQVREGVGRDGGWCIDFHTELDMPDAVNLANKIEPLKPYFVEDLVRSENPGIYRTLRQQVKVPIAVGEQFGPKWEWNELIEQHLTDYARATIPNVGGITEFQKIAAMCETHYVGLVPHFTGPISEAAMVHCSTVFSGPVLMELVMGGTRTWPYLNQSYDFKNGKLWPNDRPGLGVEVDTSKLQQIGDYKERYTLTPLLRRPDGSFTNW